MKYSEAAEVHKERQIEEGESLGSIQRQLEQFSEHVLLFILEVLKARDRAKSNSPAPSL
jgi:hypothetical protein